MLSFLVHPILAAQGSDFLEAMLSPVRPCRGDPNCRGRPLCWL